MAGGLDWIFNVPPDQAQQLKSVPDLTVSAARPCASCCCTMATDDKTPTPVFKDIRVRKAIIHAIDRQAMLKTVVGDGARVLHTLCFPAQFGCTDEGAPRYAYDPAKAKALLAEAGFPNGFEIDLVRLPRAPPDRGDDRLPARGRHQGEPALHAVRRDARRDPRGQGRLRAPDLGLVLGERRVGLARRCTSSSRPTTSRATQRCATCSTPATPRSTRGAPGGLQERAEAHRRAGLHRAAVLAAGVLRATPRTSTSSPTRTRFRASGSARWK